MALWDPPRDVILHGCHTMAHILFYFVCMQNIAQPQAQKHILWVDVMVASAVANCFDAIVKNSMHSNTEYVHPPTVLYSWVVHGETLWNLTALQAGQCARSSTQAVRLLWSIRSQWCLAGTLKHRRRRVGTFCFLLGTLHAVRCLLHATVVWVSG